MNQSFTWWETNTPQALQVYGPPVLSNGKVNYEMLAAGLGELPFGLVYSGEDESFWFRDYSIQGHCKTTDGRVEVLFKNLIVKASEEAGQPQRNTLLGLRDHSKKVIQGCQGVDDINNRIRNPMRVSPVRGALVGGEIIADSARGNVDTRGSEKYAVACRQETPDHGCSMHPRPRARRQLPQQRQGCGKVPPCAKQ